MSMELQLPEQEFTYLIGSTDRPWNQFVGRWKAIKPKLAEIFHDCGNDRPLRLIDVGSCSGFFSLQAAHHHPEADVIAVEGSVGLGNGYVGVNGSVRQILSTPAVETHLRWIQQLNLRNCMVAPEVWDYVRVCELASHGRPISDVTFLLSVVHHIDGVSSEQYAQAGLSKADGTVDLLVKLLALAPNHFVELPYKPWLSAAFDAYGSARGMLEAAARKSKYTWTFVGPLYTVDWFGPRETWLMQAKDQMSPIDLEVNPFLQLFCDLGPEALNALPEDVPAADASVLDPPGGQHRTVTATSAAGSVADPALDAAALEPLGGVFASDAFSSIASCQHVGGNLLIDPTITALCAAPHGAVEDRIGELLQSAPTPLLVAHLTLREAISEAEGLLQEVHTAGLLHEYTNITQRVGAPAASTIHRKGSVVGRTTGGAGVTAVQA